MTSHRPDHSKVAGAFDGLPDTGMPLEQASEYLKERIYATITLLALLATLWQNSEHLTHWSAALSVAGTLLGLWLAIGVASRMSYQVVHGKLMDLRTYLTIQRSHKALLVPAIPALFFIGLSALGLIGLPAAVIASMIVLLLTFAAFSLLAWRQIHSSLTEIIVTTILELGIGVGIIALKIAAGH